jgi:hypothetical protein
MASTELRLFADFGSLYTRLILVEAIEGEHRLVATVEVPADFSSSSNSKAEAAGFAEAAQRLAALLGLHGPDVLPPPASAVTSSAGLQRALIVAPYHDDAWLAVHQALEHCALLPVELPVQTAGAEPTAAARALLDAVQLHRPALIVLAGASPRAGHEHLALLAETAAWTVRTFGGPGPQPAILFAGHPRLWERLQAAFAGCERVWHVTAPRRLDAIALTQAIEAAVPSRRVSINLEIACPAASAFQALRESVAIVARRYDMNVLAFELGAEHCAAVLARREDTVQAVLHGIGMGRARLALVAEAGAERILRWLPFDLTATELRRRALNSALRPLTLPQTVEDLLIEHALAREALRLCLAALLHRLEPGTAPARQAADQVAAPPVDLLLVSGGVFRHAPRPIQAALIALDAVQPARVTQLGLDRGGVLPVLGTLAPDDPVAVALERDGLLNLGLCVAPHGEGREGETALHVELERVRGETAALDVPYGSLEVVPFDLHERGTLKLQPGRHFDVGLGRGRGATPRSEVEGGAAGLIIDARGRPLVLPAAREKRQARLIEWLQLAAAYPEVPLHQSSSAPIRRQGGAR